MLLMKKDTQINMQKKIVKSIPLFTISKGGKKAIIRKLYKSFRLKLQISL